MGNQNECLLTSHSSRPGLSLARFPADFVAGRLTSSVEPVEKVNLERVRRVGTKCKFSGCSVYDDLMLGMGQGTPENHSLIVVRGFFYRLVRQ